MARFQVGEAFLKVTASVADIHNDVKREAAKIRDIEVDVKFNLDNLQAKLQEEVARLREIEIDVTPNMTGFQTILTYEASKLRDIEIGVSPDLDRFREQVAAGTRGTRGIEIPVTADTRPARRELDAFASHMSRRTAIIQAAVSAGMLAISAAVQPAVAVIGMLPTAMLGVLAPAGALATGFSGVGDAVDAMAAAQKASTGTMAEQSKAAAELAQAMAKLAPEAQSFVATWQGEMLPAMRAVRQMVQSELFPGLEQSLVNIGPLIPVIADGLADTATIIGELTAKGSAMMASGPWRNDFAQIMESNNRAFRSWGEAGLSVLDMLRNLMAATGPITERFATFAQQSAATFASFIEGKRATGELGLFFQQMGDALAQLGSVLGQTATGLYNLATAIAPAGMLFLQAVAGIVELIGAVAQANPLLAQIAVVALGLSPAFRAASVAAGALGKAFTFLYAGGLATSLQSAALAAGVFTERMTGSAAAGEKVATGGARVAGVLSRIGQAIPIVGAALIAADIAWDHFTTSADEAAAALMEGGAAAEQMSQKMAGQTAVAATFQNSNNLILQGIGALIPSMSDARGKVDELRAAMDPLARAQSLAAEAQGNYLNVLNKTPGDTAAVVSAKERFQAALKDVETQEKALEDAIKNTNEAIREQSDAMIGTVDAEVRYRDALQGVVDSVKEHGSATDISTEAGRRNVDAVSQAVQATQAYVDSLVKAKRPVEEINAAYANGEAALRGQLTQLGLTGPQIETLMQAYRNAKPPVDELSGAITGVPAPKDITFNANPQPALDAAGAVGGAVNGVPKGPQPPTVFTGDPEPVRGAAGTSNFAIEGVRSLWMTTFGGDPGQVQGAAGTSNLAIEGVRTLWTTIFGGDANSAVGEADRATGAINGIPRPAPVQINAETNAPGVVENVRRWLNGINGHVVRTFIDTVHRIVNAEGGIVAPMASGGLLPMAEGDATERMRPMSGRSARIVPPNTWRVIGDRMVDDEAFIPINDSPWSTAILAETARRKDFQLVPMARGGFSGDWRDEQAWEWIRKLLEGIRGRPGGGDGGIPPAPGGVGGPAGPAPVGRLPQAMLRTTFTTSGGMASMTRANPLYSPMPYRPFAPDPGRSGRGDLSNISFGPTGSRWLDDLLEEVANKIRSRGGDSRILYSRR